MKAALLAAVALSALTTAQAYAQATTPPAAPGEQTQGSVGCPCCQRMAMMRPPQQGGQGSMPSMPGMPSSPQPQAPR